MLVAESAEQSALKARLLDRRVIDFETGCWRSTRTHVWRGYTKMRVSGKLLSTHRVAYTLWIGPIAPEQVIDHVYANGCRYTDCFNPRHLEQVTGAENSARRRISQTHCVNGHKYTEQSIRWYKGDRFCRLCDPIYAERKKAKDPDGFRARAAERMRRYREKKRNASS